MVEKLLTLFALSSFLAGCASGDPEIRVACQRDDIGNYIIKWETYPRLQGTLKLYVSDDPRSFPRQTPSVTANIADEMLTFVTNDNITRKYFKLLFNDKYVRLLGSRAVVMDEVQNLRDLGGYLTRNKETTRWGKLYRSGELSASSEWDSLRLCSLGIKTIIDLRSQPEIEARPVRFSKADIIAIPVATGDREEITSEIIHGRIRKGDGIIFMQDQYLRYVNDQIARFGEALRILLKEENYPILFSCELGKDKCGFLSALILLMLDVPEATVMQDYMASNEFLNMQKFKEMAEGLEHEAQETISLILMANESYLNSALSKIKKEYGSYQKYVTKELSITDDEREKLKEIMLY